MASKTIFIFLMICCTYYTINSGTCLKCYQPCNMTEEGCENKTIMTCASGMNWCAKNFNGIGPKCLADTSLDICQQDSDCEPCDYDLCNGRNKTSKRKSKIN